MVAPFGLGGHAFVTDGYLNATDFAARLDRAIDRSDRARLIEGKAVEVEDR